jgi:hypothetical protein
LTRYGALAKLRSMFPGSSWLGRAGLAAFLLVTLLAGAVAMPHGKGRDDVACSPVFVTHDERAHQVGAAPSSTDSEIPHCVLCHSLRSVFRVFDKYQQVDSALRTERLHVAPLSFTGRITWVLVPGRAPPA